jgi:PAS domain S-box-containing protein
MGTLMDDLRMWHEFLNQSPHSIVVKKYYPDGNGNYTGGQFIRVSKTKAEHYGMSIEQIRGKTDWDLLPPEEAKKVHDDDLWVMRNRTAIKNRVEKITHSDGKTIYVSVTKMPWLDGEFVRGVMSISWDITEQVRAERRTNCIIAQMRHLYAPILAASSVILTVIPENGPLGHLFREMLTRMKKMRHEIMRR